MGFINMNRKKEELFTFFQPLLDFLAHVEEFFHPPFLVITLKPSILMHNPTLKPLFPQ
jgi:hypothetical protein